MCCSTVTAEEYAQEIHTAYKKLMHGKNAAARREAAQPMMDFCEQLERGNINGGMTRKAASSMMIAAHAQFTDLVSTAGHSNRLRLC